MDNFNTPYITERDGQMEFFDNYGIPYNDDGSILVDNTDGVYNGNILEFKLSIGNLNRTLFQAVKYLSRMCVRGESVPATILLVDLNATTVYVYTSEDYRSDIQKVYAGASEQENDTILSGRVWLDETFYTVEAKDIQLMEDGTMPRGLSANQLCIGVACTEDTIICLFEGNGRPSKKKTYAAFKDHIAPGSTLVHDKDYAHGMLIEKLGLISESYDSKELKNLPDNENPLRRVNEVHARLKDFFHAHSSFDRDSIRHAWPPFCKRRHRHGKQRTQRVTGVLAGHPEIPAS